MRAVVLASLGLLLAGCDHMYGAVDGRLAEAKPHAARARAGVTDDHLIQIAREDAARRRISLQDMVPEVSRDPKVHIVSFWYEWCPPPHNCIGGGVEFMIAAKDLRVVNMIPIE